MEIIEKNGIGAVCLTGDIHQISTSFKDQFYLQGSEVDAAIKYVDIAANYGIKMTLFFTGKSMMQETKSIEKLSRNPFVELGGHNYNAFLPRLPYKLSNRILGLANGPKFIQRWDIVRTLRIFREKLGKNIICWRDHAYRYDKNTQKLLTKSGIMYLSDIASPDYIAPFKKDSLYYVPINVLPDHDYVFHGSRMPGTFSEDVLLNSAFKTKAVWIPQWFEKVKEQILVILKNGGLATILAHPACMEICDNYHTFEKLCQFISQYYTIYMSDIGRLYAENIR